jgi:hypothetical protein
MVKISRLELWQLVENLQNFNSLGIKFRKFEDNGNYKRIFL